MAANAHISFCLIFMTSPAGIHKCWNGGNTGGERCVFWKGKAPMPTYSISTKVVCTLGRSSINGGRSGCGGAIAYNVANLEDSAEKCSLANDQSR